MLPIFSQEFFFRGKSIFRFGFQKRAKCCPFFSQEFFFGTNRFLEFWVSKEGEMLPIFPQEFFETNRFNECCRSFGVGGETPMATTKARILWGGW